MIQLTEDQRSAVGEPGNLLLTACPGSGKTRTLIAKLVSQIEAVRGSPRSICCITYTNSAVNEIEQRAREQLQPDDEQHFTVCTIHSFCLGEIVRPYGWMLPSLSGRRKILTRDSADFEGICAHAAAQVNLLRLSAQDYEAFESLSVNAAGQIVGLATANEAVRRAARYYWARCAELGYLDFGNIIYGSYCLLRDFPQIGASLSAKYAWFLVDEFQDTTELQIELLKLLYAARRSRFFAVGDLDQSIYGFTGARPELVAPFGVHIQARQDIALSQNFRSSQRIVDQAECLLPRLPPMVAAGSNRDSPLEPTVISGITAFQAITEEFLLRLQAAAIPVGEATILAKDWASLIALSRQLRDFGVPVVGPGARPYKRARLFAPLAEQFCGAIIEPNSESNRLLSRALFHAIQDVTEQANPDVFTHEGRVALVRLMREARRLADIAAGGVAWLDAMSAATGRILHEAGFIDAEQANRFFTSVQEMKADMHRQNVDMANLTIDDLGLFASPSRALRLSTIHYAKGREYEAVAIIGMRRGTFPHYRAEDISAEKRLFYVGITRARRLLMYIADRDSYGNPPSPFLGPDGVNILR